MRGLVGAALAATFGVASFASLAPAALAQQYPARTVTIIVPYAAGGITPDLFGRIVAAQLSEDLPQKFIIENKGGAAGVIGTRAAAQAAPDGYTLLFHAGAIAATQASLKEPGYDARKDFEPVSLVMKSVAALHVTPSVPARSIRELLEYAKANPGKLRYASTGAGSTIHMTMEYLMSRTGTEFTHVPYSSMSLAIAGFLREDTQIVVTDLFTGRPFREKNQLRLLAVMSRERFPLNADLPTFAEGGGPEIDMPSWYGLFAPAKTPKPIIDQLNGALKRILSKPDVADKMRAQGFLPVGSAPEELRRQLDTDIERWTGVIRDAKIAQQ